MKNKFKLLMFSIFSIVGFTLPLSIAIVVGNTLNTNGGNQDDKPNDGGGDNNGGNNGGGDSGGGNTGGNGDNNKPSELPKGWAYKTNTTPQEVKQYSIDHNRSLHFNYPNYNGNKVTLKADGSPSNNKPGPGIIGGDYALEGYVPTDKHAQLAKQSYSVGFKNGTEKLGTCWILDYKLTDDNTYPTTWYFGTNAHVIDDLKVRNDKLYPEKFGEWDDSITNFRGYNTEGISLWQLRDPKGTTSKYPNSWDNGAAGQYGSWKRTELYFRNTNPTPGSDVAKDGRWKGYYPETTPLKTIFSGNDFLKISPSDSSTNPYSNKEEYADFGVFELTFDSPQQAQETTNNYANWDEELKFKYYQEDLLKNPSLQTDYVYDLGYPEVESGTMATRVVATNINKYDNVQNYQNKGLSTSVHYNSFDREKLGMFDGIIAMPWFGYSYEWIDNNATGYDYEKTTSFSTYGLIYGVNNGNMRGGSSGGLTLDDNGYALGVHFASDNNAATGSSQAFYCSGYDYKGYYGNHNLPQYDLIRGGYPLQKNSYYDGLVAWYGNDANFKTRLFPNGLNSRQ